MHFRKLKILYFHLKFIPTTKQSSTNLQDVIYFEVCKHIKYNPVGLGHIEMHDLNMIGWAVHAYQGGSFVLVTWWIAL